MDIKKKKDLLLSAITDERLWLFILSIIASVINYVFQICVGRSLTVHDYGGFNYVVAFMTNCCSLYTPFSIIVCRLTSGNDRNLHMNKWVYYQIIKATSIVSILMLLFVLIYHFVFNFSEIQLILLIATIICAGACAIILGVIQGLARYFAYGLFNALMMGIKLILAFFIAKNKQGAVVSLFLSELVVVILALIFLIKIYQEEDNKEAKKHKELTMHQLVFLYGGTLWVQLLNSLYINNGEILLLKHVVSDDVLGLYSVAAILCRGGMYATSIISTIILSEIAYTKAQNKKDTVKTLNRSLLISLCIAAIYVFFLVLTKGIIIQTLYGAEYLDAGEIISRTCILAVGISLLPVINSFYLGINKLNCIITIYIIGVLVALVFTFCFKISFERLIILYGLIILSLDLVGYLLAIFLCKVKNDTEMCN